MVTKSTRGQNCERTAGSSDRITLLVMAQGWPVGTWHSQKQRALHQAARLHRFARRSGGGLIIIRLREDVDGDAARRRLARRRPRYVRQSAKSVRRSTACVADGGGLIGIGFWDQAVCGTTVDDIVWAIRHVIGLVGADHVALGSDFDGTVKTAFDASGMPLLTQALLESGFIEGDIREIMGGNVFRLLGETLPIV